MGNSLLSGVSGLQAHQRMLDAAGDNLANVNTTAFKSSRVNFAALLSETMREATQPTSNVGGTNPMQIGSGVVVSSVDRNMSQGSLQNTGQPLDMAIEGSGYFCLSDAKGEVFTRVGAFAVDSQFNLVDPATGFRVQRIGSEGVSEGFQSAFSSNIRIPYDVALPANATQNISYTGTLSANATAPTLHKLTSGIAYTRNGTAASVDTKLNELDQVAGLLAGDTIAISGYDRTGTAVGPVAFSIFNGDGTSKTVGDLLTAIQTAFPDSNAVMGEGRLLLSDKEMGYSKTDLALTFGSTTGGEFTLPKYFTLEQAGGRAALSTNVQVYDAQGVGHEMAASFVRTNDPNKWDLVVTSITGDVDLVSRRIEGITFLADGSYGGTGSVSPSIQLVYANDPTNVRTVNLNFGTIGEYNGLSQAGDTSTVSTSGQDGYANGWLSSLSVSREGVLVGVFTNGIRRDIAALKIATFQNAAGLTSVGNNYFLSSANSGQAVPTRGLSGGAGAVRGGALEKSNVEVATEFVNLINAQNGYQANARTIKVANEMLRELTNLIR